MACGFCCQVSRLPPKTLPDTLLFASSTDYLPFYLFSDRCPFLSSCPPDAGAPSSETTTRLLLIPTGMLWFTCSVRKVSFSTYACLLIFGWVSGILLLRCNGKRFLFMCDRDSDQTILAKFCTQAQWCQSSVEFAGGQNCFNCLKWQPFWMFKENYILNGILSFNIIVTKRKQVKISKILIFSGTKNIKINQK